MKIFRGHMGLGDHIVCNALVRHLAKDDTIIVPVKKHYETSIKFMFSDDPNIIVKPFSKDKKADKFCRKQAKKGIEIIWNGLAQLRRCGRKQIVILTVSFINSLI